MIRFPSCIPTALRSLSIARRRISNCLSGAFRFNRSAAAVRRAAPRDFLSQARVALKSRSKIQQHFSRYLDKTQPTISAVKYPVKAHKKKSSSRSPEPFTRLIPAKFFYKSSLKLQRCSRSRGINLRICRGSRSICSLIPFLPRALLFCFFVIF